MTSGSETRAFCHLRATSWLSGALLILALLAACSDDAGRAKEAVDKGETYTKAEQWASAAQALFTAVDADPDYRPAHTALLQLWREQLIRLQFGPNAGYPEATQIKNAIDAKYIELVAKYPNSPEVARGYGMILESKSDPRASRFLLVAAAHDPKDVEVWRLLRRISDDSGDVVKASEYARKAALVDPENADDQYYYIGSLEAIDKPSIRT
jgi:tetratricopeptide (TPR) repeat protein